MSMTTLMTVELVREHDVVLARQRARQLAAEFKLDGQDQIRFATAVSELARNAHQYAGGGRVEFRVDAGSPATLIARIIDRGPGIARLKDILDGRYVSSTGLGIGIIGARRLADDFSIESSPNDGTEIVIGKRLSPALRVTPSVISGAVGALAAVTSTDPLLELQQQSQELLRTLAHLREKQVESDRLAQELAETNRGVLALYAELDERALYLERANDLKTRFLSDLNHEIRTPLNAVRNVARLLLDGYEGPLTDRHRRAIEMMRHSTDTLSDLVNDWLDLAKIEAGRTEVRVSKFSADDLWGALRGVFRPIETDDAVSLVFEPVPALPLLQSDEAKVAQILRNFISNALKFTERGEVRVSAREGERGTVVFTVTDTGIGIAPENFARVFEEFSQVDSPLQRRVRGTGLGLPLSRRLARLLGGEALVESEVDRGSKFSLVLPIVYTADGSPGDEPHAEVRSDAEVSHV
ncbi:MAG TPA: ATP-binding protein [Gemmatimonadaceae bacterium]|nr:ATP-binding protein [Gemmatimonadaceae bacterium]